MELTDAVAVQRHLRSMPTSTFTDPGGSTHQLHHCVTCGHALVAEEQDETLHVDDASTLTGTPVTDPDPGTACRCAELIGGEFTFPPGYSPYVDN